MAVKAAGFAEFRVFVSLRPVPSPDIPELHPWLPVSMAPMPYMLYGDEDDWAAAVWHRNAATAADRMILFIVCSEFYYQFDIVPF